MYIPQIKDKHPLIDLARYGTKSRKSVHPDLLIGTHPPYPIFKEGDILDGNATFNLIQCACDQHGIHEDLFEKIDDTEKKLEKEINTISQSVSEIENKYDGNFEEVETQLQQVTEDITQCSSDLQYVKDKHESDIQQTKQYIDTKLEERSIQNRFVYDELEEQLFIIR